MREEIMKSIIFILIYVSISTTELKAQVKQLPSNVNVPVHPRILFTRSDETLLKNAVEKDSTWRVVHEYIISECNRILTKPLVEYKLEGKRLLNKSREFRKRSLYLGYAWRTTGDSRFSSRLERELLNVCSFKDWNPSHFLDVAEMTMGASIGYDWLFNNLSASNKSIIKEAIVAKGLKTSLESENNWWLKEGNNWNQVCNAGMVSGALAVFDEEPELSKGIINRALETIQLPMKDDYDPDGVFAEGYGYWAYGTTFNVYLISMLEKCFGSDFNLVGAGGFAKTSHYLLHMVGPTGLNFNYSDGEAKCVINPAMFWFAARQNDQSVLFSERQLFKKKDMLFGRDLPMAIIWGASIDLKKTLQPSELIWSGKGKNPVALMRSSWKPDAIFVGLKGGSASVPHAHMDVGSFVVDAMGERWAMDFGMQEYNSLESKGVDIWNRKQESQRWQVFRYSNFTHNTLSFNNSLQQVKGFAPIKSITSNPNFLSAITDLTEVYKGQVASVLRGVAIADQKFITIRDEVATTNENTSLRWTMLTAADVRIVKPTVAELTKNGKKMVVEVFEPTDAVLKTWSTNSPHDYDEPNPGTILLGFELNTKTQQKINLTVLLIPSGNLNSIDEKVKALAQWK